MVRNSIGEADLFRAHQARYKDHHRGNVVEKSTKLI